MPRTHTSERKRERTVPDRVFVIQVKKVKRKIDFKRWKWWAIAQIVLLIGVLGDYATTCYGIRNGFVEINAQYTLTNALLIFSGMNLILVSLEPTKKWQLIRILAVGMSWYGMLHNLIVLLSH